MCYTHYTFKLNVERREEMFISENQARAFRHKRADMMLTKTELAKKIGITRITLSKIERGNYKAPKRIYQSVMDWLTEDL